MRPVTHTLKQSLAVFARRTGDSKSTVTSPPLYCRPFAAVRKSARLRRATAWLCTFSFASSSLIALPQFARADPPTRSVSGTITLDSVDAVNTRQPINFEFTPTGGGSAFVRTYTLDDILNGHNFTLGSIPSGVYNIGIKGSKWLRANLTGIDLTSSNYSSLNAFLPGGDANGDNMVDIGDFGLLVNAYGTMAGDPTFDSRADFTCDNVIDIGDFGVLTNNYNGAGNAYEIGLTAIPGSGQISLAWNTVPNATSYTLYRSATPAHGSTPYRTGLTGTTFTDTNLPAGTYYYQIVANGVAGLSNETQTTVTAPAAPPASPTEPGLPYDWEEMVSGVNTLSGNKLTTQPIVAWTMRGGMQVDFTLVHNSQGTETGPLGSRWTHSLDLTGKIDAATGNVTLHSGDGSLTTYTLSGGVLTPPTGVYDSLTHNGDGTYTLRTKSQITYQYDANLRCQSITDTNSNTLIFHYDGAKPAQLNYVEDVNSSPHRFLHLFYDANGKMTSVQDPLNRQWTLAYDGSGRLASVQEPMLANDTHPYTTGYQYDGNNTIKDIITRKGTDWKFGTDAAGRQTYQTDPAGNTTTFTYTGIAVNATTTNRATIVTDANGNADVYAYDANGRLILAADPQGYQTQIAYATNTNNVSQVTDRRGKVWKYQNYDVNGNCWTTIDPKQALTAYTYDAQNHLLSVTDANGHTTTLTYTNGNLTGIEDPLHHTQTFTVNSYGLLTDAYDGLQKHTHYGYDGNGNLTQITPPVGHATNFVCDVLGRVQSVTYPLGNGMTTLYDTWGRVSKQSRLAGTRPNTTGTSLPTEDVTYNYDANDNVTQVTDENGHSVQATYDNNDRLLTISQNQNHTYNGITGDVMRYYYDGNGPDGTTLTGQQGLLTAQKDGNGNNTFYAYTLRDELARISYPDGIARNFAYDPAGNPIGANYKGSSYANGLNTITAAYDECGNLLHLFTPDAGNPQTDYVYDPAYRVTSVTDSSGVIGYTYDEADRVRQIGHRPAAGQPFDTALNYAYYDNDWRRTLVLGVLPAIPDSTTTYTYNANGLLQTQTLTVPQTTFPYSVTYEYNDNDFLFRQTAPNGLVTTYGYDQIDRLTDQSTQGSSGILFHNTFAYDPADNVIQQTDIYGGQTNTTTYQYDWINQLTHEQRTGTPAYDFLYAYDHHGNRVSKTIGNGGLTVPAPQFDVTNYNYNADQLTESIEFPPTGPPREKHYTYDDQGNVIKITDEYGNTIYDATFDSFNRLKKIDTSRPKIETIYTGDVNIETIDQHTVLRDGDSALRELLDGIDIVTMPNIVHVPMLQDPAHPPLIVEDVAASTIATTDSNQNVQSSAVYDAYGNVRAGGTGQSGYRGGRGGRTSGGVIVGNGGRAVYNPETGRYMNRDGNDDTAGNEDDSGPQYDNRYTRSQNTGPHPGVAGARGFVRYTGTILDTVASLFEPYNVVQALRGRNLMGDELSPFERFLMLIPLGLKAGKFLKFGCFVAGTPVAMADGTYKPIEQVKVGDRVLSRDAERSGPTVTEAKQVTQTSVRNNIPTLSLTFSSGETIETTSEHPFYVEGAGFVPAGRLSIGNAIVTRAGPAVKVVKVERHESGRTVYNFTVAGDHTYFVGKQSGGVWVHNIACREFEVGIYSALKRRSIGLGLQIHHIPQAHLMEEVYEGYSRSDGLAVALRNATHTGLPATSRLRGELSGAEARQVRQMISQQLRDLKNAGVPKETLREIGRRMRQMYPRLYRR